MSILKVYLNTIKQNKHSIEGFRLKENFNELNKSFKIDSLLLAHDMVMNYAWDTAICPAYFNDYDDCITDFENKDIEDCVYFCNKKDIEHFKKIVKDPSKIINDIEKTLKIKMQDVDNDLEKIKNLIQTIENEWNNGNICVLSFERN